MKFIDLLHPEYQDNLGDWEKYRLAYKGGDLFIERYLQQFSSSETVGDFATRKSISYCPAFAKAAINDVKNSIFQRIVDVKRLGGPKSYQDAMKGLNGGVDRRSSTMDSYVGRDILEDLLVIGKVGIYVDRPEINSGRLLSASKGYSEQPYFYSYKAEDIINWVKHIDSESEYSEVLLREYVYTSYENTLMVSEASLRYRHVYINEEGFVTVRFFNQEGEQITKEGEKDTIEYPLKIRKIPFVCFELSGSLMCDVANYQIALLNLASSDMNYGVRANFPFYVEHADSRDILNGLIRTASADGTGTATEAQAAQATEINVGAVRGRKYTKEAPQFIHPSPEPLEASIKKQDQLKSEIRQLINLAISSLQPKMASAESKSMDMQGLESGLSYIGLELQHGERKIAEYWAMYEDEKPAQVNYPKRYNIKTDEERREEAESLSKQQTKIPSITFQKVLAKKIVRTLIGTEITDDQLEEIDKEIDAAEAVVCDPDIIHMSVEKGIISKKLAAKSLGYPEGDVDIAEDEHRERVLALAEAQAAKQAAAGARGADDLSADPKKDAQDEKKASRDNTNDPNPSDKTRGKGK